ncbi:MAG: hypothetical protein E6I18_10285 [Chloroflexi bacterium]|nr:MAG: hypothetical protein E6I18_10285 [Chloroflexota bacterium]
MVVRVFVCFVLSALALSGGLASAAPRYSDWGNTTYFAAVNTPELEFANGISKDGLTFYFQRGNALANGEDIWIAHRASTDAPWDAPLRLPDTVNSAFNDRAAIESSDGHWLYLASNRPGGKGDFDLYVSWRQHTHDDLGWQAPVPLTSINTVGFDSGPTVFEDEQTGTLVMYFVSNPAGSQNANVDIYRAIQMPDGSFGQVETVSELNSTANEGRPYVRHDGLEIFFNSARPGLGLTDIWVATRGSTAEPWSPPVLAPGINTKFADNVPALSWDGRTLYFSSNRSGSNGEIYYATRQKVHGKP